MVCYAWLVLGMHKRAWLLMLLSAGLQIVVFPLPDLYFLCWFAARSSAGCPAAGAGTGHAAAPRRGSAAAREAGAGISAGLLLRNSVVCRNLLLDLQHHAAVRRSGYGRGAGASFSFLFVSCSLSRRVRPADQPAGESGRIGSAIRPECQSSRNEGAGTSPGTRLVLLLSPFLWVAVELARTRITGFPWGLLGIAQVDNIPLSRIATVTGVYGLSFEIMVVNTALAAAFVIRGERGKRGQRIPLLLATIGAVIVLQSGRWISPPPVPAYRTARLVQANIPILQGSDWTKEYFDDTVRDLGWVSWNKPGENQAGSAGAAVAHPDLIVWPDLRRRSTRPIRHSGTASAILRARRRPGCSWEPGIPQRGRDAAARNRALQLRESGQSGRRVGGALRQDASGSIRRVCSVQACFWFCRRVDQGSRGFLVRHLASAACRRGAASSAFSSAMNPSFPTRSGSWPRTAHEVFVNISNDGWYGDSGAYAQHLKQARMRAVENNRWLLRDTNTGVTAAIDPYGRVVSLHPAQDPGALDASYALTNVTTFYTRHGDWFAYLCAIISVAALLRASSIPRQDRTNNHA